MRTYVEDFLVAEEGSISEIQDFVLKHFFECSSFNTPNHTPMI